MHEAKRIVINTSPLIALSAAMGDLSVLKALYEEVIVPFEVCQEIEAGKPEGLDVEAFREATWLNKRNSSCDIPPLLLNSLDCGEASVIQVAIDFNISTVCIDETAGRRIAR